MAHVPLAETYIGLLAHYSRATPEAEAWVHRGDRATYRELEASVRHWAAVLRGAGVRSGDRVAMLAAPGPQAWTSLLAAHALGAIWVGINPRYSQTEIAHVLDNAEPRVWLLPQKIEDRSYGADIAALARPSLAIVTTGSEPAPSGASTLRDLLDGVAADETLAEPPSDSAALLIYTSGTSGKPKGALLSHRAITAFSRAQAEAWGLAAPRGVAFFPINHVSSALDSCGGTLAAGGTVIFLEQFSPTESLALMEAERATVWGGMPSVFQFQMADPSFASRDLSAVELIAWGGAGLSSDLVDHLQRICPRMTTNYGLTETSSAITILRPTDDRALLTSSVGTALPGVEIRIAELDTGTELGPGAEGEIQTRSALNLVGYWRDETATARAFTADGFFKTGDIGILREDGHLELRGRIGDMYKSGGFNVYPREVEDVLEAVPGVYMAAVLGMPDPTWQEVGIAFVVAGEGVDAQQLKDACSGALANYKHPKRFVLREMLPMLANGKVDRRALRNEYKRDTQAGD